jgi:hypothetical protein
MLNAAKAMLHACAMTRGFKRNAWCPLTCLYALSILPPIYKINFKIVVAYRFNSCALPNETPASLVLQNLMQVDPPIAWLRGTEPARRTTRATTPARARPIDACRMENEMRPLYNIFLIQGYADA